MIQREIQEAAYRAQQQIDSGATVVVGVNRYADGGRPASIDVLRIDPEIERRQVERVRAVRASRERAGVAGGARRGGRGGARIGRTSCRPSFARSRPARPWARSPTRCARLRRAQGNRCLTSGRGSGPEPSLLESRPEPRPTRLTTASIDGLRPRGHRRQLRSSPGRNPVPGRRIRQRQVDDGALDHAARPAARADRGGPDRVPRPRPAHAVRARDAARARRRNRPGLPGADDGAESGLHHRQPDRGNAPRPRTRDPAERHVRRPSSCSKR